MHQHINRPRASGTVRDSASTRTLRRFSLELFVPQDHQRPRRTAPAAAATAAASASRARSCPATPCASRRARRLSGGACRRGSVRWASAIKIGSRASRLQRAGSKWILGLWPTRPRTADRPRLARADVPKGSPRLRNRLRGTLDLRPAEGTERHLDCVFELVSVAKETSRARTTAPRRDP